MEAKEMTQRVYKMDWDRCRLALTLIIERVTHAEEFTPEDLAEIIETAHEWPGKEPPED
jgi:hypothetical protein